MANNILVSAAQPVAIRRPKGSTITFINQNASMGVDIYISADYNELASWGYAAGVLVPEGTKLAAGGGALQYPNYPGVVWARAISDTSLQVLP